MKKSLLALAVLASAAGAANAASSVTMYGRVDVGYEDWQKNGLSATQGNASKETESRFGIKGQEDLGNGLAATFQLEGRFDASTGSYSDAMFARESTVGLKGNFGHVRFGRSKSAMERGLGDFNVGERVGSTDPYLSSTRHSNGLFYDYSVGGFSAGFDVTTKNGAAGNTDEGSSGSKVAYGAFAGYKVGGFAFAVAHQADRSDLNAFTVSSADTDETKLNMKNETGAALSYTFNPVTVGLTYAQGKATVHSYDAESTTDTAYTGVKVRTAGAYLTADVTANDSVYLKYQQQRAKVSGTTLAKSNIWAIGGAHALSKRTSVYADVARVKDQIADESSTGYSVGLRHAF